VSSEIEDGPSGSEGCALMLTRTPARNRTIAILLRSAMVVALLAVVAGGAQASSIGFGDERPSRPEIDDFDRESKGFSHRNPPSPDEVRAAIKSALERFFERHRSRSGDSDGDSMSDRVILGRIIDLFRRRHEPMDDYYPTGGPPSPAVPEPGTALLLGLALAGLAATRRD